jgi:hypothetical protein
MGYAANAGLFELKLTFPKNPKSHGHEKSQTPNLQIPKDSGLGGHWDFVFRGFFGVWTFGFWGF